MADLLLNDHASAEKEFAILRGLLTPLVGDSIADQTIASDRLLAAGYAGHWQQVNVDWPQLARKKKLVDLPVSRAYLETGDLPEAELYLRSTLASYFLALK